MVILACCIQIEERVEIISGSGGTSSAYDFAKNIQEKELENIGAEVVTHCPSIGRSSALAALKKLVDEGNIIWYGSGRSTYYVKADKQ